jgi:hypothetical protein
MPNTSNPARCPPATQTRMVAHGPPVEIAHLEAKDFGHTRFLGQKVCRVSNDAIPTGCAGPWKTLVSIRWRRSHDDARAKPNLTDNNGEFPTALASRPRSPATTAIVHRLQLSKFRIGGAYRPSSDFERASVLRHRSYAPQVFNQAALVPPRMPRGDFSAWAFLIVAGVHF